MAAFSVDTSKQTGGDVARSIREGRAFLNSVDSLADLFSNMTDTDQAKIATGFSGTDANLRDTYIAAQTALQNPAIQALLTQVYWD